jgi:hypothetical protein
MKCQSDYKIHMKTEITKINKKKKNLLKEVSHLMLLVHSFRLKKQEEVSKQ